MDEFDRATYITWARSLLDQMRQAGTIPLAEADAIAELDLDHLRTLTMALLAEFAPKP